MTHSRRSWAAPAVLVAIYLGVAMALLGSWGAQGVYSVTGDEPHYLVMADSLSRFHSLELTDAYTDEFVSRRIYTHGLAPAGTPVVEGVGGLLSIAADGGVYSVHGPGLAVLLAVPLALGGVLGAKLAMIALGATIVLLAWGVGGLFVSNRRARFFAVAAIAIGYPFVPAATQIYPDLLAGIVVLAGITVLLKRHRAQPRWLLATTSAAVAFLPWLGMKFVLASAVLIVALSWSAWRAGLPATNPTEGTPETTDGARRAWHRLVVVLVPALVLYGSLAALHLSTVGNLLGRGAEGSTQASLAALMVGVGLLLDQNQGLLIQNLALWAGVFGLATFARRDRWVFFVWTLTFAAIWVPGAMHPLWYGGGSFSGRFSWALGVLMIVPAMAGFGVIRQWSARAFWSCIAVAITWNTVHLIFFAIASGSAPGVQLGIDLYNKPTDTWLENYAVFAYPLHMWFPALYDDKWAFGFVPNGAWLLLLVAVAIAGWRPRIGVPVTAAAVVFVLIGGFIASPGPRAVEMAHTATVPDRGLVATGPSAQMRLGSYEWWVEYSASAPSDIAVGRLDVIDAASGEPAAALELVGTRDDVVRQALVIPYRSLHPHDFVLQVWSYGSGAFTASRTGVLKH